MELIIFTHPQKFKSEIPIVISLFEHGLMTLHIRKNKFSTQKLSEYIEAIPQKYHNRIIIHSHHRLVLKHNLKGIHLTKTHRKKRLKSFLKCRWYKLRKPKLFITRSFHQLESLGNNKIKYSYVFLSPFFSKMDDKKNSFDVNPNYIRTFLGQIKIPVYASGNIDEDNILLLNHNGLSGVGLSKMILSADNPAEDFLKWQNIISKWQK